MIFYTSYIVYSSLVFSLSAENRPFSLLFSRLRDFGRDLLRFSSAPKMAAFSLAFFGGNTAYFDLNAGVYDSGDVTLHFGDYFARLSPLNRV